ncbi:hypothetical protein BH10ACI1_BH10ACI1_27810 [soil metagenome]
MKKIIFVIFASLLLSVSLQAQTPTPTPATTTQTTKKPVFRATKDQIMQVQKMLKEKGLYTGEADGRMNPPFRISVKSYQKDNGLRQTGTLNRATLEKMSIVLTDKQKEIPVDPNSFATSETTSTKTTKRVIFRATKEQIMAAQKILKDGGMYEGEQTGKLDEATRAGLKKYQAANGLNVTGTLNQVTLLKMGIALTDKQKADAAKKT